MESIADRYRNGWKTLGRLRRECGASLCAASPERTLGDREEMFTCLSSGKPVLHAVHLIPRQ
jgi:hypothetical protein